MQRAEFEERAYEAPLYNQLERGERDIYAPGQVLEGDIGFDRGLFLAEHTVWDILGYHHSPPGIALGYYAWPGWGLPKRAESRLPRFRLNLFIQAKRPEYHDRRPRKLKLFSGVSSPLWSFEIKPQQQRLLEVLAKRAGRRAHVTYAAPAFHSVGELYRHTRNRSIVLHSTFPSAGALSGHERWYYSEPGAVGVANPSPEMIEEPPLLARLVESADGRDVVDGNDGTFEQLAHDVAAAAEAVEADATSAQFFDDLQTLDRLIEPYGLDGAARAYAHVRLFTARYSLTWLVFSRAI